MWRWLRFKAPRLCYRVGGWSSATAFEPDWTQLPGRSTRHAKEVVSRVRDPLPVSTVTEVVVPILVAAGAGTVASLLAPWAQWGVDRRRQVRARRVEIIAGIRELVHQGQAVDRDVLLVDPRYLAVRPHLDAKTEEMLREQTIHVVSDSYGTVGNVYLAALRDEADRLEQEWKLT